MKNAQNFKKWAILDTLIEKRKLIESQDGEGTDYYWKLDDEPILL